MHLQVTWYTFFLSPPCQQGTGTISKVYSTQMVTGGLKSLIAVKEQSGEEVYCEVLISKGEPKTSTFGK